MKGGSGNFSSRNSVSLEEQLQKELAKEKKKVKALEKALAEEKEKFKNAFLDATDCSKGLKKDLPMPRRIWEQDK